MNLSSIFLFVCLLLFIIFPGSKKFLFTDVRSCSPGGGKQAVLSSVLSTVTGFSARFFSKSHKRPKDPL